MLDETAEIIALKAAAYLISDDDLRDRFLDLSGLDEAMLRQSLHERVFLISVLEFFVNFEPDLITFAEAVNLPPGNIALAWRTLGGGTGQDW